MVDERKGYKKSGDNKYDFKIHTENMLVARKCFTLLRKAFNIDNDIVIRSTQGNKKVCSYLLQIGDDNEQLRILQALKVVDEQGKRTLETGLVNSLIIPGICCKRAFIRGAFLAAGSISDPEKFYHLEIDSAPIQKHKQKSNRKEKTFCSLCKRGDQDCRYLEYYGGSYFTHGVGEFTHCERNAQFCKSEGEL